MDFKIIFYVLLQWLSSIAEIFISYCLVDFFMNDDSNFFRQHKVYIVVWSVAFGTMLSYNRQYTGLLSWVMIILQSILILLTVVHKNKKASPYFCIILAAAECFGLLQLFFTFIFNILISDITLQELYFDNTIYRTISYAGTVILLYSAYFMATKYKKVHKVSLDLYLSSYLLYDFAGLCAIFMCQKQLLVYSSNKSVDNVVLLLMFLCTAGFLLLASIKRAERQLKMNMLEFKAALLEENYREIETIYQNFMYTYHDIKNHFIVIQNYCKEGKSDKAVRYIEKVQKPICEVKRYINSGNEILDIILNFKLLKAEKEKIRTEIFIESNLKNLGLEEDDLCAVFSNLLDNAIEACRLVPEKERYIFLTVKELGEINFIKIINSCHENSKKASAIIQNRDKKGIHGYGLKSVEAKVKKYGGKLKKETKNGSFTVTIKLSE